MKANIESKGQGGCEECLGAIAKIHGNSHIGMTRFFVNESKRRIGLGNQRNKNQDLVIVSLLMVKGQVEYMMGSSQEIYKSRTQEKSQGLTCRFVIYEHIGLTKALEVNKNAERE